MVERTRERAVAAGLTDRLEARGTSARTNCTRWTEDGEFDGAYSNSARLNCVPELTDVSRECARLLKPGGALVFSVIGRICPWEVAHFARRRSWARIKVRFARTAVPVGMNKRTIWTRYYGPREFYRAFAPQFTLEHYRGLCTFVPPPYLTAVRDRHPQLHERFGASTVARPAGRCFAQWAIIF